MYILFTTVFFLWTARINGFHTMFFLDDDASYNPCHSTSGVYFYSHRTDIHKYYQCDESDVAHLRSCGDLVWDELLFACNWPSAVIAQPPRNIDIPTTTTTASSSIASTTSSTTLTSSSTTTESTSSSTTTESTSSSTTTESTSTSTNVTSFSLCQPVNPCGKHGQCLESPATVPISRRRFACVCSENWFGRLCDKQLDQLTTPTMDLDQDENVTPSTDTFSIPVHTEKDSRYIFFGLKPTDGVDQLNNLHKRMVRPMSQKNI